MVMVEGNCETVEKAMRVTGYPHSCYHTCSHSCKPDEQGDVEVL